jgi:uncharacterized membrane protein
MNHFLKQPPMFRVKMDTRLVSAKLRWVMSVLVCSGLFVVLLFLIPNEMGGRIVFIGCGSVLMLIGYLLYRSTHPRTPKLDVNP